MYGAPVSSHLNVENANTMKLHSMPGSAITGPALCEVRFHGAGSPGFNTIRKNAMTISSPNTMMICPVCELSGGPFDDEEAALRADAGFPPAGPPA